MIVDGQADYENAKNTCKSYGADLAYIPTLASYIAFESYFLNAVSNVNWRYWIGAKKLDMQGDILWSHLQLKVSDMVSGLNYLRSWLSKN